jgi:hypothetical protein
MKVRLTRELSDLVIVWPRLPVGAEVDLPPDRAQAFIDSGIAVPVEAEEDTPGLEAAALRSPRRRG